jgi:hypothetical protein
MSAGRWLVGGLGLLVWILGLYVFVDGSYVAGGALILLGGGCIVAAASGGWSEFLEGLGNWLFFWR